MRLVIVLDLAPDSLAERTAKEVVRTYGQERLRQVLADDYASEGITGITVREVVLVDELLGDAVAGAVRAMVLTGDEV